MEGGHSHRPQMASTQKSQDQMGQGPDGSGRKYSLCETASLRHATNMPGPPRIEFVDATYHATCRGNGRQSISFAMTPTENGSWLDCRSDLRPIVSCSSARSSTGLTRTASWLRTADVPTVACRGQTSIGTLVGDSDESHAIVGPTKNIDWRVASTEA